jgi:hypothetical protein
LRAQIFFSSKHVFNASGSDQCPPWLYLCWFQRITCVGTHHLCTLKSSWIWVTHCANFKHKVYGQG